jgi:uncharacterized protein
MFDPVILFFLLGVFAGISKSDLKIPAVLYESLSIFLLLAIGLKGGVALSQYDPMSLIGPIVVILAVSSLIPIGAFLIAHHIGRYSRFDAGSLAAHYGSVSVVTFAVGTSLLMKQSIDVEGYMTVFLVLLEIPGLLIGVFLAKKGSNNGPWAHLLKEIFTGKSILLLVGGLLIGYVSGEAGSGAIAPLFFGLFKGVLAIFLLEMGLVTASRLSDIKKQGVFLICFGTLFPIAAGLLGITTAWALNMSVGGMTLLGTLFASASYIAAPAAVRMAVPEANPSTSIAASLGITFPFNITIGIPLYLYISQLIKGLPS